MTSAKRQKRNKQRTNKILNDIQQRFKHILGRKVPVVVLEDIFSGRVALVEHIKECLLRRKSYTGLEIYKILLENKGITQNLMSKSVKLVKRKLDEIEPEDEGDSSVTSAMFESHKHKILKTDLTKSPKSGISYMCNNKKYVENDMYENNSDISSKCNKEVTNSEDNIPLSIRLNIKQDFEKASSKAYSNHDIPTATTELSKSLKDVRVSLCKLTSNFKRALDICTTCLKIKSLASVRNEKNRVTKQVCKVDYNQNLSNESDIDSCNTTDRYNKNRKSTKYHKNLNATSTSFKKSTKSLSTCKTFLSQRGKLKQNSALLDSFQKHTTSESSSDLENISTDSENVHLRNTHERKNEGKYSMKCSKEFVCDNQCILIADDSSNTSEEKHTDTYTSVKNSKKRESSTSIFTPSSSSTSSFYSVKKQKTKLSNDNCLQSSSKNKQQCTNLPVIINDDILPKDTIKVLRTNNNLFKRFDVEEAVDSTIKNTNLKKSNSSTAFYNGNSNFNSIRPLSNPIKSRPTLADNTDENILSKNEESISLIDNDLVQSKSISKFDEDKENCRNAEDKLQHSSSHKENENRNSKCTDRTGTEKEDDRGILTSKMRLYYNSIIADSDNASVTFPDVPENDLLQNIPPANCTNTIAKENVDDVDDSKKTECNFSTTFDCKSKVSTLTIDNLLAFTQNFDNTDHPVKSCPENVNSENCETVQNEQINEILAENSREKVEDHDSKQKRLDGNEKSFGQKRLHESNESNESNKHNPIPCSQNKKIKLDKERPIDCKIQNAESLKHKTLLSKKTDPCHITKDSCASRNQTEWIKNFRIPKTINKKCTQLGSTAEDNRQSNTTNVKTNQASVYAVPIEKTCQVDTKMNNENNIDANAKNIPRNQLDRKSEINCNNVCGVQKSTTSVHQRQYNDNVNFNKGILNNVNDSDDCISLFAESTILKEFEDTNLANQRKPCNALYTDKPYLMDDKVLNNFINKSKSEFKKEYRAVVAENKQPDSSTIRKTIKSPVYEREPKPTQQSNSIVHKKQINDKCKKSKSVRPSVAYAKLEARLRANKLNISKLQDIFEGYCYGTMRNGTCMKPCKYNHHFDQLINQLYVTKQQYLLHILDYVTSRKCRYFPQKMYIILLPRLDRFFIIKMFEKLYKAQLLNEVIIHRTITELINRNVKLMLIVKDITSFVFDWETAESILSEMEKHVQPGQYWCTLKDLVLKIEYLNPQTIENILQECVTIRAEYAQDIYSNVVKKLLNRNICDINPALMSSFNSLLMSATNKDRFKNTETNKNIDQKNITEKFTLDNNTERNRNSEQIRSPNQSQGSSTSHLNRLVQTEQLQPFVETNVETRIFSDTINTDNAKVVSNSQNETPYVVHPIDNPSKPYSAHGRKIFWKFYLDLISLQEGLEHKDYEHVISILDKAANESKDSIFARACYHILCGELKQSQYHLNKIISLTVRTGTTIALRKLLFDFGIDTLLRLTDEGSWILAYKLAKDLGVHLCQNNASLTILLAEIYLANRRPVKAFVLLKQNNILYTSRHKWSVPNNSEDENIRAKVVGLLLDSLCEVSLEHTIFLFEFLIKDQASNFWPIDLTQSARKIIPVFLLRKDTELIVRVGKLIMEYDIILSITVYRAITAALVNINLDLAKELYQRGTTLGVYGKVKLSPTIHVFVNPEWTEEEMYLMVLDLLNQISFAVGHAINSVGINQLVVYFIFEIIPSGKELYYAEGVNDIYKQMIKKSKQLMKYILQNKFHPSLRFAKKYKDRICKLTSKSIVNYLKMNVE